MLEEAEFYNLRGLIQLCNERIAERETPKVVSITVCDRLRMCVLTSPSADEARISGVAMPRGGADERRLGHVRWLEI